jgi:hypothetical protein
VPGVDDPIAAPSVTPEPPVASPTPEIDGRPIRDFLNSEDYLERLVTHLIGYETWIGACADAEPLSRDDTLMVSQPISLPDAELASGPQWIEIIELQGCDRTYKRLIYATYVDGAPVFHVQLPGNTRSEPVLQHRAINELRARESETAWSEGCERSDHARVIAGEVDDAWQVDDTEAWREIWVVLTCSGIKHVPVIFQPDDAGEISFTWEDG